MVKNIVKDVMFLRQKSEPSTEKDKYIAEDLKDTLKFFREGCVGMAANMTGYRKRTIIVAMGFMDLIMHNPTYISRKGEYMTEEGCLSLVGVRKVKRYNEIEVKYQDENFVEKTQKFSGYIAEIVQHEMDHLDGIII